MVKLIDPLLGIDPIGNEIPSYLHGDCIPFATANFVTHENGHVLIQHFRDDYFEGYLYRAAFKKDTCLKLPAKPAGHVWLMVQKGQISWIGDSTVRHIIPENHCYFQPADHSYDYLEIPMGSHDVWAIELSDKFLAHMNSELSGCFEKPILLDVSLQTRIQYLLNTPNLFKRRIDLLYMINRTTEEIKRMVPLTTYQPEHIQAVRQYIEQHYDKPLNSQILEKKLGFNSRYMRRGFKMAYGTNIASHVRNVRMHQAKKLLVETHTPIAEITFEVGYESAAAFSKVFTQLIGYAPSVYRKRFQRTESNDIDNL